ncbi:LOW QUALITY PROTEIN: zinc finger protein 318 [Acipenser ruthenus]|uniref:LOW QUALITY PROTEIN: zinc finger protein 318 n=1 Tax=Acipenser ruthenus TaxID=7906 RepID=UPI0027408C5F|nr:LOW QUALITY PROTEIN: zinc finger protein 318 [Acipenser ruthenus]
MFRGRPHRGGKERGGGHPRHYTPRGPPGSSPPRHSPPPGGYRDERDDRERHHFSGYREKPDGYRRSPAERRYPSPGRGSNRGPVIEYRGPPQRDHPDRRLSPSPPHSGIPLDHSLIITVGNERSHSVSPDHRRVDPPINHRYRDDLEEDYSRNPLPQRKFSSSHDREEHDFHGGSPHYPHRREEGPGGSSREREKFHKLHYLPMEAKRPKYDMEPEGRGYSSERSRRPERTVERGRRSRSRGKSRGRSRSRSRDKSRGRSRSASPLKGRLKNDTSEGFRELAQARKRKEKEELERLERAVAQREMGGTKGYGIPGLPSRSTEAAEFRQQRVDEVPPMPKKSILKKRVEPEMDPADSIQSSDYSSGAPGVQRSSSLSAEAERFLNTLNRGMDSELFSSLLREAREETYAKETKGKLTEGSFLYDEHYEESFKKAEPEKPVESAGEFLLPHERVSQDGSGFSRILGMMGEFPSPQEKPRSSPDIEDEEKFLYGEEEDERSEAQVQAGLARQQSQPGHSGIVHRQQSHPGMDHQLQNKSVVGKQHSKTAISERQVSQAAASRHQENQPGILHRQNQSGIVQQKENQSEISHQQLIHPRIPRHQLSQPGIGQHQESKSGIGHHQQSHTITGHPQESQPHSVHSQQSHPMSVHGPCGTSQEDLDTSPVEAEEIQDSQEYEKIQTLLKTIGLDMGVAEIGKLAARTQERLHGKKPPGGSSCYSDGERGRRVSAGRNWENQRSHSHTKSPESDYNQSISPSPTRRASHSENLSSFTSEYSVKQHEKKGWEIPVLGENVKPAPISSASVPPTTAQPNASLPHTPTYSMPSYSHYQPPLATPNFPPPGYDQYGNYMPYMSTGWPMYAPPSQEPQPGPQQGVPSGHLPIEEQHVTSSRPYLRVIETVSLSQTQVKPKKEESALVQVPMTDRLENNSSNRIVLTGQKKQRRESEEKNKANEKQKVIEERVALKKEKEVRLKRKDHLMKELERLRKQQGELLRKKRREKDGHKDPLLVEVSRLQEEVMQQISVIRKENEAAEKKQAELDKVAQILGLYISDKQKKTPKDIRETPPEKRNEKPKSPEKSFPSSSSSSNASLSKEGPSLKSAPGKPKCKSPNRSHPPLKSADQYEYYDAGNHWCKNCNTLCGSMFDFFTHMHSKAHRKTQDPYDRPWASKPPKDNKHQTGKTGEKIVVPAKGSEFLTAVIGFYCQLCEEFFGDQISAEDHVSNCSHNEKYKKYVNENPLYEQRRNLDRQAGLAVIIDNKERRQTELKRKMEEEPKVLKEEEKKAKLAVKKESEEPGSPMELCEKAPAPLKGDSNPKLAVQLRLKKKPEESAKNSADPATFGKFCWKKSDKEEEKVSEPTTEKEELGDGSKDKEDGKAQFGKTKTIAIKLSGKTVIPHTSVWMPFSTAPAVATQAKIRPNLPAPVMQLRKTSAAGVNKPAPLNAFLSIRPAGTTASKPLPVVKNDPKKNVMLTPDLISKAFCGEEVVLKTPPVVGVKTPATTTVTEAKTPVGEVKSPTEAEVKTPVTKITPLAVPEKKTPSISHPVMQIMSFKSDVAAPGVPESEQNLTVLVRPPPLHKDRGESTKKNEKPKSNLAAANAQDLYDIFYSSGGKGTSDVKNASKNEINVGNTETRANCGESIVSCSTESENKSKTSDILLFSEVEKKNEKQGIQKEEDSKVDLSKELPDNKAAGIQNDVLAGNKTAETGLSKDETGNVDAGKTNQESVPVIYSPGQDISSNNVTVCSGIPIDDPISLITVPWNKEIRGRKILDSLETRNLMSSNTESHTLNTEENLPSHSFLHISSIPESLELNTPSDDPEPLKLEITEGGISVDLGSFETPALNFETPDLNLDTYDFCFETADLNIPETETETVTQEVQNVVENAEALTLEMPSKCSDLSPARLEAELHVLESVGQSEINREEEMHSISGHLMLEDIGEVVGSFALETDTPETPEIISSQEAERPEGEITPHTALESLEASQSDNVLEKEAKEQVASLSSLPKDEDLKDPGLVDSISDTGNNP